MVCDNKESCRRIIGEVIVSLRIVNKARTAYIRKSYLNKTWWLRQDNSTSVQCQYRIVFVRGELEFLVYSRQPPVKISHFIPA